MVNWKSKIAKFDWSRLVPTVEFAAYPEVAFGIEPTWGYRGLGLGVGLGRGDFWFGWPRREELLHYRGCGHSIGVGKVVLVDS